MKSLFFILGTVVVCGCGQDVKTNHDLVFIEMLGEDRGLSGNMDTVPSLRHHTKRDSLIGECYFAFNGSDHVVTAWRDDHYAPIDGGSYWVELDTMGAVYSHSTVWPGFTVVRTNSDSLNHLIMTAIGAAARPYPHGIQDPLPHMEVSIETVQFKVMSPVDSGS